MLYTHFHADHTAGIDDLKAFNAALGGILPCFGDARHRRFLARALRLRLRRHAVDRADPAHRLHRASTPRRSTSARRASSRFRCATARSDATGYRIGNFAYLTDTSGVPASSRALLHGLEVLVVDALRWEPHPTHLSVPEALELIADIQPARTRI